MTKWVCNTIAYGELMAAGQVKQADVLASIAKQPFNIVELRQEFIKGGPAEQQALKEAAERLGLTVFLSIPDVLFLDGNLNVEIEPYFKATAAVGGVQLKLNLGEYFVERLPVQLERIQELIDQYQIQLVVENDQTSTTGNARYLAEFCQEAKLNHFGVCFDVGNFLYFAGGDPVAAAQILYDHIKYIHLKEVDKATLEALPYLYQGDVDIKNLLPKLPNDVPVAVECQYHAASIAEVEAAIAKDLAYLEA